MSTRRHESPPVQRAAAVLVAVVALLLALSTRPAAAHTDFETSTPADGAEVPGPLDSITIAFTSGAEPSGEGFEILAADGIVRAPSSVVVTDDRIFELELDPPLTTGVIAVRWEVRAGDAHPIDGTFTFTITGDAPTAATSATDAFEPDRVASLNGDDRDTPATTHESSAAELVPDPDERVALEEFLSEDPAGGGENRQWAGRVLSFLGITLSVGMLVAVAAVARGSRQEFASALVIVAGLGAVTAGGAALEYWGHLADVGRSATTAWVDVPGRAMALRLTGGVILAAGAVRAARRLVPGDDRWRLRSAPLSIVGAALVVSSFWFDGHTVSRGPRLLHVAADTVHVVAAATWFGGVATLALILVMRQRRSEPSGATDLIVRFSSVATAALFAVAAAGLAMTALVVDEWDDLVSTEWGRLLLLKLGAVGAVTLIGAHNHFRLRPALLAATDEGALTRDLRRGLLVEVSLLVVVVTITAALVTASI